MFIQNNLPIDIECELKFENCENYNKDERTTILGANTTNDIFISNEEDTLVLGGKNCIIIKFDNPDIRSAEWLEKLEEDLRMLLTVYRNLSSKLEIHNLITGNIITNFSLKELS